MYNVYTNTTFEGFYPVGTAAVVVAETPEAAADLLNTELQLEGLPQKVPVSKMLLLDTSVPKVAILDNGDY